MTCGDSPPQNIEEHQMADPQDRREEGAKATPPAKKAAAKKAPAKKAAAKKAPVKKAPAKKAPAKKAAPHPAAMTAAAAPALKPTPHEAAAPRPPQEPFGRGHTIPLSLGLAAAGLVAIGLSRLRRG
jgi:hypothetical protein